MSLLADADLITRPVSVAPEQLVLLKHHLEASEGLGFLIAKKGGDALLVSHRSLIDELDAFIADLKSEMEIRTTRRPSHDEVECVAQ